MSLAKATFAAAGPAIAGFAGGVLGGIFSDWLLEARHCRCPTRARSPILSWAW